MKKITLIGIAVAVAIGFISCQKENISNERNEGQFITETFSATFEGKTTKTTISDDGTIVTWSANDKVYYYTADEGEVRNSTVTSAGSSATLTLERGAGDTYYNLVFAGSAAPSFTAKTSSSMVFDGVKASQDGTFANANVSVARTAPGSGSFAMKPVTALVKFTTARTDIKTIVLTGGAGTETVAGSVSVDLTAASPVATFSGTGSTLITVTIGTPAAGTYYINVLPGTYSNGLKLMFKDSSNDIIGTATASNSIDLTAGGKMINLGDIDSHIISSVTDLSAPGTANCYIVSAAGQYKFRATQGNETSVISGISSVKVLWESFGTGTAPTVGDLANTVSYKDGYICFTASEKKGNAVIAALGGEDGFILWSWHIWMTDTPALQTYNGKTWLDRNLGATLVTPGNVAALGLFYEWGRKDPFLGLATVSGADTAVSTGGWPEPVIGNQTVDYTIKNPTTYISGNDNSNFGWTYTYTNLWSSVKTKYDPCPAGYHVPAKDSWSGFTTDNFTWDQGGKGRIFGESSVWYPAAGRRNAYSKKDFYPSGTHGYYWTCEYSGNYATCLHFDGGSVSPAETANYAAGVCVRCVRDE